MEPDYLLKVYSLAAAVLAAQAEVQPAALFAQVAEQDVYKRQQLQPSAQEIGAHRR